MSATEWPSVFEAQFGRRLNPTEVEIWDDEFLAAFPGIKSPEIIPAIRSVAAFWQDKSPCGAKDIISRIRTVRQSQPANKTQSNGCTLCAGGWITFWAWYEAKTYPNTPIVEVSFGDQPESNDHTCLQSSIACTCSLGDKFAARTENGAIDSRYSELRNRVASLRRRLIRASPEELADDWEPEP